MALKYSDILNPDDQITTEEAISALIFDRTEVGEEYAQGMGRDILLLVLTKFRPDLVEDDTFCFECEQPHGLCICRTEVKA
jgi:hypothetical protein